MSTSTKDDMTTADEITPQDIGFDQFVLWLLANHGEISYDDFEYEDETLGCTCRIARSMGRPESESLELQAAVARLRSTDQLEYNERPMRERVIGRKVYPAQSRVTLKAR